jgi:hypothetical protein
LGTFSRRDPPWRASGISETSSARLVLTVGRPSTGGRAFVMVPRVFSSYERPQLSPPTPSSPAHDLWKHSPSCKILSSHRTYTSAHLLSGLLWTPFTHDIVCLVLCSTSLVGSLWLMCFAFGYFIFTTHADCPLLIPSHALPSARYHTSVVSL